jgi:hypothetical protein
MIVDAWGASMLQASRTRFGNTWQLHLASSLMGGWLDLQTSMAPPIGMIEDPLESKSECFELQAEHHCSQAWVSFVKSLLFQGLHAAYVGPWALMHQKRLQKNPLFCVSSSPWVGLGGLVELL